MKWIGLAILALALPCHAQYSVHRVGDAVRLEDRKNQVEVSVVPGVGNVAFSMKVKGHDVLYFPYASVEEFRAKPALAGIPFVGPWANRLDETGFFANGKRYAFNMDLGNVRGAHPIHGFLSSSEWRVITAKADAKAAWVVSRLEFYRQPAWMAQFPFAHALEMTYRLQGGVLEVNLRIENMSSDPMPVAIGFHPYFRLTDSVRDQWTISVGARTQWMLSADKLPTGETRPIEQLFPNPQVVSLKDYDLDHVFGELVRDAAGRATMAVQGKSQRLEVSFGPNYRAAVIWAPKNQGGDFICFEPMAGITNALNLAQRGLYKELQTIPPGRTWQESFWIRPSGF